MILDNKEDASNNNAKSNEEKVAVVTGANSGIGYETAKALGRAGFHTILACRNEQLGQEAVERLVRQTGLEDRYEFAHLDLASLESVRKFVDDFKARGCPLDVLVNNAGVMVCPYGRTKDDIELQFGTNHVGHFVLTTGLLDCLKQAQDGARVIVLSSLGASMAPQIDYEMIEDESKYNRIVNYGISKLANQLFATALARKLEGTNVTVNISNPGTVATNLTRHVGTSWIQGVVEKTFLNDPLTGALTSICLALSPEVKGVSGKYYSKALPCNPHPNALDVNAQDRLWSYTEDLIARATKKK
ncbi:short-chain dehydrogenase/reductase SDR [Coemansia spiralis]|nr:short-chain dehydrogenase/reductase SDR [Coemansia spiralis]